MARDKRAHRGKQKVKTVTVPRAAKNDEPREQETLPEGRTAGSTSATSSNEQSKSSTTTSSDDSRSTTKSSWWKRLQQLLGRVLLTKKSNGSIGVHDFNGILGRLRLEYIKNYKGAVLTLLPVLVVSILVSIGLELVLPQTPWFYIVLMIPFLPIAACVFAIGYMFAWDMHYRQVNNTDEGHWIPMRSRLSPKYRYMVGAVIAAILMVVFVFNPSRNIGYTTWSGVGLAAMFWTAAYMRQTPEEKNRSTLGLPDPRDRELKQKISDSAKTPKISRRTKAARKRRKVVNVNVDD